MELKKHLNSRVIFVSLYVFAFIAYIIYGLQPARAVNYDISATLNIPSIDLIADVTALELKNGKLDTPDTIVGSYSRHNNKTLLIGHSTTVFNRLNDVHLGDELEYNNSVYHVVSIDLVSKPDISMTSLLKFEKKDTLILMTCAGELLDGNDATHRLMIKAVKG